MAGTSSQGHLATASAFWPAFNDKAVVSTIGVDTQW